VPPEDTLTMVPSLIVKPLLVWPEPRSIVVTRPYFPLRWPPDYVQRAV
jgi:hypothetical protein